ncbi:MAG TPA: DUF2191 domain-containing protein [Terriglobia bacterium]|nr:DUF2191 domain-containing protein [Terriglobia bacterium]
MKTTIDIDDSLLRRAKRHALKNGKSLRFLVEEGIRRVLDDARPQAGYHLPDRSVGVKGAKNPLESLTWQDLRDEIYGGGR